MDKREIMVALNSRRDLSRAVVCRLAAEIDAWRDAKPSDARVAANIGVPLAQLNKALSAIRGARFLNAEQERLAEQHGCRILTRLDEDYPPSLFDLSLPPPVLYCRGDLPFTTGSGAAKPTMAIVGARKQDEYGRQAADLFGAGLAAHGVVVVSGFAIGVDQTAHRAAVEVGGKTVAVHGCGLDINYPKGSRGLAKAIAQNGASITEFPFGCEPRGWHFPVRNRVIAALAAGVVVIQAKQRSGSLITAQLALELGRDVLAVPGSIFEELAMGTNSLIADGAAVVTSPGDVLDHLSLGWQQELFPAPAEDAREPKSARRPDGFPGKVHDLLVPGETWTAEELATKLEVRIDQILAALLELEIGAFIHRRPGPVYERARPL